MLYSYDNDEYVDCLNIDIESFDDSIVLSNEFSVLTINVRGLRGRFPELLSYLSELKKEFTFIILTEVWLDENLNIGFQIPNYNSVCCLRNNRGGGIVAYYKDSLHIDVVDDKTGIFESHEALLLNCHVPNYSEIYCISGHFIAPRAVPRDYLLIIWNITFLTFLIKKLL
jgi:hypothetical protein